MARFAKTRPYVIGILIKQLSNQERLVINVLNTANTPFISYPCWNSASHRIWIIYCLKRSLTVLFLFFPLNLQFYGDDDSRNATYLQPRISLNDINCAKQKELKKNDLSIVFNSTSINWWFNFVYQENILLMIYCLHTFFA